MYLNIEMKKATSGINVLHLFCSFLIFLELGIHAEFDFSDIGAPAYEAPDFVTLTKDQITKLRTNVVPEHGLKELDKITKLPGQPPVDFDQYSGYITVNQTAGRALFYYFAEASAAIKDTAPLIMWFNGGPGCSSLGYGAMGELGPFRVGSDGRKLYENVYAWNKVGNVLFIESPVGVGYTYSNTSADLLQENHSDQQTAADVYVLFLNWLERFPEYKHRDVFITGESFAGHYVPQLADTFLQHNKYAAKKDIINLKGIAVGNAVLDSESEITGMFSYYARRGFVDDDLYENIVKTCDQSKSLFDISNVPCTGLVGQIQSMVTNYDQYFVYYPACSLLYPDMLTKEPKEHLITKFDPCSTGYVRHYLNDPDVQLALHANVTKIPYPWKECGKMNVNYSPKHSITASRKPLLENLLNNNVRVLIFSGDGDGAVPITMTKEFIARMNRTEVEPLALWNVNDEIAGGRIIYEGGLTLATVLAAGHMVPSYQPERALVMIKSFVENKPLPLF